MCVYSCYLLSPYSSYDTSLLQAKQFINTKDPRYDAVGSASVREALFNIYVKTLTQTRPHSPQMSDKESRSQTASGSTYEKDRKQRALREREEKVRREREGIERQLDQTRDVLGREAEELEFGCDMCFLSFTSKVFIFCLIGRY